MFNRPLVPGLSEEALCYLDEGPTPEVIQALGGPDMSIEAEASQSTDFYQIISSCPGLVHGYTSQFRLGNLSDERHVAIRSARRAVLVLTQDLVGAQHLTSGVITPGGTGANELALHLAREKSRRKRIVLASPSAHSLVKQVQLNWAWFCELMMIWRC